MENKKYNEIDLECNILDDDLDDFGGKSNYTNINTNTNVNEDYSKYNEIDMECNLSEDFEDDNFILTEDTNINKNETNNNWGIFVDFSDDEEEVILEKKDIEGSVDKDYLKKLSKQHKATNVKGARGSFETFPAGDPIKNMQMFNHMMNSDIVDVETSGSGDICGTSCSEELVSKEVNNYNKLFKNLLVILGFDIIKKDNDYLIKDIYNYLDQKVCKNKDEILVYLKPYCEDNFIYPLQLETKQNFNNFNEWVDWYKDNETKFPKLKNDISYCDLIANHFDKVNI